MQVTQVNNNTNFNGKTGWTFNRFKRRLAKSEINVYKELAKSNDLPFDDVAGSRILEDVKCISSTVNDLMTKFHPRTKLVKSWSKTSPFIIKNPIGGQCRIANMLKDDKEQGTIIKGKINLRIDNAQDLLSLKMLVENLSEHLNVEEVEKAILEDAVHNVIYKAKNESSWMKRVSIKRQINKMFKYKEKLGIKSEELDLKSEYVTKESLLDYVEKIFENNKAKRQKTKQEAKQERQRLRNIRINNRITVIKLKNILNWL